MPLDPHRRRQLIALLKILLAAAILSYLFVRLKNENAFSRLVNEPKQWPLLAAAQLMVLSAFAISCVRWWVLVRALQIDFSLGDAFRLGSLGFMLSQVSLGSIGGDLFKAVFIAREQPNHRTHAVASVLIDRVMGLYAMLLVASCGMAIAGGLTVQSPLLRSLTLLIAAAMVVGTICLGILISPAASSHRVKARAAATPVVGPTLTRLVEAAEQYRNRRGSLYASIGLGVCTHTLLISGIWTIGQALPISTPSLANMILIVPSSLFVGAIPATPGGLGTFEATMGGLFGLFGSPASDGSLPTRVRSSRLAMN